jgi:hypothetical protein
MHKLEAFGYLFDVLPTVFPYIAFGYDRLAK